MNNTGDNYTAFESLRQWFQDRDIEKWQNTYGISVYDSKLDNELKSYSEWCTHNEVPYTPCSILDGYIFPQEYKIADLPLLVGDRILHELEKGKSMSFAL